MLFGDALRTDDSIVATSLDLKAAHGFSESMCGPHSAHVSRPNRFKLSYRGHLLKSLSTTVGYIEHGTDVSCNADRKQLLNSYNISLPLSGEQELRCSGAPVRSGIDRGILVSPEQKLELDITGDCRKLLVTVARSSLEQTLSDILGKRVDELLVFSEDMDAIQGSAAAWWRMVKNYMTEMECAKDLYGCGYFSQAIEASLIKGLLVAQPSNYSARIKQALGVRVPEYVTRAKSFIETRYRDAVCLQDIEEASGVTRIKLFESFRTHTGFTPMAYLKHFRLRQARDELLRDRSNQNVSSIALGVGFNHLGRFSLDYKREFSETPSDTIHRKSLALS